MPSPDSTDSANPSDDRPDSPDDGTESPDDRPDSADPRMNDEYVRRLPDAGVTLVGVVHDHPASVHRAREVVRERDPAVVALESPPLATPLYETYARESRTPPSFGGEMSAAAQAAHEFDAEVVGIDAPTGDFFVRLARNCWRDGASLGTLRKVVSGVTSVTRHALVCRVAAAVADRTALRVEVDDPVEHDCDVTDPPAVQARDEVSQARRSQSLLRAFDPPRPVRLRDETREECMAENLDSLRSRGETVAVVGLDHLDGIAERLEE
ncbi:hypothetical protein [Halorussus aquaticus]|uniref:Universal stress protein family protein n=1 Tax=Halorussus aquaticus TaxID=2953748 RepID=A0ABD5Q2G4_9EURY|nr:hypothetical protein [Halorussus aquaticus]